MKLFLAGNGLKKTWLVPEFFDFYRLESFYYIFTEGEENHIHKYKDFIIDSGAYTYMNTQDGSKLDWDDYIEKYADFINTYKPRHFMELDIDNVVGLKEVERLRKKLEKLTARKCIPVWHKSRGKNYYIKMIQEYDYVAIGGIVTREIKPSEYKHFTWLIDEAAKYGCRVHGLGFTNLRGIHKYNFYSVDSTSWLSGNRFGSVYKFTGKSMIKTDKQPGQRVKTWETATNNFFEWVKFSQYADRYL